MELCGESYQSKETLLNFYKLTTPGGPGWKSFLKQFDDDNLLKSNAQHWQMPLQLLCVFIGIITIYSLLFAGGFFVYMQWIPAVILTIVGIVGAVVLFKLAGKLKLVEKGEK